MAKRRLLFAALLVLAALGGGLARERARSPGGPDLKPRPDALEYGMTAARLAGGGGYALEIGGALYPPRYPIGFPLLAAPVVRALGGEPSTAWRAAWLFGALAVVLAALLAHLAAGRLAAATAAAVVALSPAAVAYSNLCMSESASMALWLAALAAVAAAQRGPSAAPRAPVLAVAGLFVGLALLVRYTNLALLLPALGALWLGRRGVAERRGLALSIAALGLPVAAAAAALLVHNAQVFGSPFRDGYRFWGPLLYEQSWALSFEYAFRPGRFANWESGNLEAYLGALGGWSGGLVTLPVSALALLGLVRVARDARRSPAARTVLLASVVAAPAVLAFHACYYWQAQRFLLPLVGVLAVLCGAGVEQVRRLAGLRLGPRAAAALALLLLALVAASLEAERGEPARGEEPMPPLASVLPELDGVLEHDALVVVNFPWMIAANALGPTREIVIANLLRCDRHLQVIHALDLVGRSGERPGVPVLARGESVRTETSDALLAAVEEGRPVYVLLAKREGPRGAGIDLLRRETRFERILDRPPVTLSRLASR